MAEYFYYTDGGKPIPYHGPIYYTVVRDQGTFEKSKYMTESEAMDALRSIMDNRTDRLTGISFHIETSDGQRLYSF